MKTLAASSLPLPLLHRGKVREVYEVDADRLLMVASDRVSAFDVVMPQAIPMKGRVLTQISAWWLSILEPPIDHHLLSIETDEILEAVPALSDVAREEWEGRTMLVRRTDPVLVECVVRAYISGSAWKEYVASGTLAGEPLPVGLEESGPLPEPIFSPATKAQEGHDENITFGDVERRIGSELAHRLRELSFRLFAFGHARARERGILLADTKFEFGIDRDGKVRLIDEVLTPDSSRYWAEEHYRPGGRPVSFDKQPVRDYLDDLPDWDKRPPPPDLPPEVVSATTKRYLDIFERLTGTPLERFTPPRFDVE